MPSVIEHLRQNVSEYPIVFVVIPLIENDGLFPSIIFDDMKLIKPQPVYRRMHELTGQSFL